MLSQEAPCISLSIYLYKLIYSRMRAKYTVKVHVSEDECFWLCDTICCIRQRALNCNESRRADHQFTGPDSGQRSGDRCRKSGGQKCIRHRGRRSVGVPEKGPQVKVWIDPNRVVRHTRTTSYSQGIIEQPRGDPWEAQPTRCRQPLASQHLWR